jgi:hypothetical protein
MKTLKKCARDEFSNSSSGRKIVLEGQAYARTVDPDGQPFLGTVFDLFEFPEYSAGIFPPMIMLAYACFYKRYHEVETDIQRRDYFFPDSQRPSEQLYILFLFDCLRQPDIEQEQLRCAIQGVIERGLDNVHRHWPELVQSFFALKA